MMDTTAGIVRAVYFLAVVYLVHLSGDVQAIAVQTAAAQSTTQTGRNGDERGTAKSEEFINTRPGGNHPHPNRYHYRLASGAKTRAGTGKHKSGSHAPQVTALEQGQTYATIGVTIGRGRRATEAESKDHNIAKVHSKDGSEFVLERITDNTTVTHGTPMQMMIEYLAGRDATGKAQVNRLGYLYVINRVQYLNGAVSQPRLIFPTRRTYGGDSQVLPGKVVTLPDPQRLWEISRNPSGPQAFETYLIIISPAPLKDRAGRELQGDNLDEMPLELDERLVAEWVRQWGSGELRADLENGSGKFITQREQSASGNLLANQRDTDEQGSDLTLDDPPPQMVFRKVVKPAGKMLVMIKLPFKDAAATASSQP